LIHKNCFGFLLLNETTVDVVEAVENAIQGKNCTFSAFVIAAVRSALEDLEQDGNLETTK
jgi:hypothetical protein